MSRNLIIDCIFPVQVLDLVDHVYCLVEDLTFSFRIEKVPGLLLGPFKFSTVKCAFDFFECSLKMPPGDPDRVESKGVSIPGTMLLSQLIDDCRLCLPNHRFEISADKKPG